jgi:hypothetical protein
MKDDGHEERIGFEPIRKPRRRGGQSQCAPRTSQKRDSPRPFSDSQFVFAATVAAALLFALVCLLAAEARGDNRPSLAVEYGECDDALEQWGRAALFSHIEGPVWQDFDERDSEVVVVIEACRFFHVDDPKLCVRVVVKNRGWRGQRGDRAKIQWQPDRWQCGEDAGFKLVQLRTNIRASYGPGR